ncbi:hypothetical protein WG922_03990 [Ramlibacter sp. AN1015]|uniref:hypothetical protein n=1 Tax=Ramlibacter sp. AN1015 TaxID=3133428 RepID=UPI0030C63754
MAGLSHHLVSGVGVIVLALVHLWGNRLRFLDRAPRSIWLSASGGVSVAYVFLHLLPELDRGHHMLQRAQPMGLDLSAYLLAMAGLTVFYGVERLACGHQRRHAAAGDPQLEHPEPSTRVVFALHVGAFALYNWIIGVVLVQRDEVGLVKTSLFTLALAMHFLVNDYGLRAHYRQLYHGRGRWLLAGSAVAGWLAGATMEVPELALQSGVALLAGGIIMNVMKEELPTERESRFGAFAAGVAGYGLLLWLAR